MRFSWTFCLFAKQFCVFPDAPNLQKLLSFWSKFASCRFRSQGQRHLGEIPTRGFRLKVLLMPLSRGGGPSNLAKWVSVSRFLLCQGLCCCIFRGFYHLTRLGNFGGLGNGFRNSELFLGLSWWVWNTEGIFELRNQQIVIPFSLRAFQLWIHCYFRAIFERNKGEISEASLVFRLSFRCTAAFCFAIKHFRIHSIPLNQLPLQQARGEANWATNLETA